MWFTDTPWPPVLICIVIGAILYLIWYTNRRNVFLLAAAGMAVVAMVIVFVERAIVTEAERIEANVHALAAAVKGDDIEGALRLFSGRADDWQLKIAAAMTLYDISDDMRITDVHVTVSRAKSSGVSQFRANGIITGKATSAGGHFATQWRLRWQREGEDWKITDVTRLHPITDEPMGFLDRMD